MYESKILQQLTADAQQDCGDINFLLPLLQEIDTVLSDLETRIAALESPK